MKKRISAVLACVVLLISALGLSVFAEAEEAPNPFKISVELKKNEATGIAEALSLSVSNTTTTDYYVVYPTAVSDEVAFSGYNNDMYSSNGFLLNAGKTLDLTYHIEGNVKDDAKVDLRFSYYENTNDIDSIVVSEAEFSDILNETSPTALEAIRNFVSQTAFNGFKENPKCLIMILIAFVLAYLAIGKGFRRFFFCRSPSVCSLPTFPVRRCSTKSCSQTVMHTGISLTRRAPSRPVFSTICTSALSSEFIRVLSSSVSAL